MLTIFFVDDDESVLKSFRRLLLLSKHHYSFHFFSDPQQALLSPLSPDVLITDSMMPHMTGRTLIKKMKNRFPACIAVLVTGELRNSEEVEELFDYFLEKPCDVSDILAILEELSG
jgi:c-di-GMP phosphodiesterase